MLNRWMLVSALLLSGVLSFAAPQDTDDDDLPPPPPPGKGMKGDKGIDKNFWRAYNEMSSEERKEMRKLQLKDMAEFKKQMDLRVEKIRQRDQQNMRKIKELVAAYQTADAARQVELKTELRKIIEEGYMARLRHNRNHLEEMRRRARQLDKELSDREKNAERYINEQTERVLKSEPEKNAPNKPGRK